MKRLPTSSVLRSLRPLALPGAVAGMLGRAPGDAGDRMLINFTTVANVVGALNGLQDPRTIVHKIAHFQSRGFPLPRAGNRRRKPMLDTNDAMRLVVACELLACGIPTARTTRMVDGAWTAVSTAIARAALAVAERGAKASEVVSFAPDVMHDAAGDEGPLHELVETGRKRPPHRLLSIDLAATLRTVAASLEAQGVATAAEVLAELQHLGAPAHNRRRSPEHAD